MIIIADSTPLHYLVEIDKQDVLKELFGKVIIPQGVSEELQHANAPQKVRHWFLNLPEWIEVRQADLSFFHPEKKIGKGEHQAIALAIEIKADAILADDRGATLEARRANLLTIPTLNILEQAARRNLIDLEDTIDHLLKTGFYVSPKLIEEVRDRFKGAEK